METKKQENLAKALEDSAPSTPIHPVEDIKYETAGDDPEMDYDVAEIEDFLDVVFHSIDPDSNILTWFSVSSTPSFPTSEQALLKKLKRSNKPYTFYFGTSSCQKHEDGRLYNRKDLFTALHVIVLDDIGTKIPLDRLPEELTPNYIIETSEGNFQYGYVLAEPITDLAQAEALIHLVYTSGLSDSGGKMPTKVVRLPCGVNGKEGVKRLHMVKIKELNDDYWTPEDLLRVMDVGVTWESVLEDVKAANGGRTATKVGTSIWSSAKPVAVSLSGIVDPTLEWLYDNHYVINDNGSNWVTITCPWADGHTSGSSTAGYSPIGRGGDKSNMRGFKCQHDHCSGNNTPVFLKQLSEYGAPEVPMVDNVAEIVASYAYISGADEVARIRGVKNPTFMKMNAFRNTFTQNIHVHDINGKLVKTTEAALWSKAPNRLVLTDRLYNPASMERVIDHDNQQYLNTYTSPDWGNGDFDVEDVNTFNAFLEYLIPVDEERAYFIEWLSAKAQNPTFKGSALLMVAPTQGTGRTTLTDMITTLFTHPNVSKVTFNQMIASGDSGVFNEWLESSIVTCDEVMSKDTNKYHTYETLKDMFDPRPKKVRVNVKYGAARSVVLYTSYIMLTNHTSAIGALGDDRRVYVISNTTQPESHDYFCKLNAWLGITDEEGRVKWARSVWRWLQTLEPDVAKMNDVAPTTYAKRAMIDNTTSFGDRLIRAVLNAQGVAIYPKTAKEIAHDVMYTLGLPEAERDKQLRLFRSLLTKHTSDGGVTRLSSANKLVRLRVNNARLRDEGINSLANTSGDKIKALINKYREQLVDTIENHDATVNKIAEELEDFI